jgi:hypothetical protein
MIIEQPCSDAGSKSMQVLFNYNFNPEDIIDLNFEALYEMRRRDSCFAFAFEKDGRIYALRDHFGTVPLYFSLKGDEIVFSTTLDQLITSDSRLNSKGYKAYVAFGTAKILPLFEDIGIVPPASVIEIDKRSKEVKVRYTYKFKRCKFNRFCTMDQLLKLLDRLLLQAAKRTVKYHSVGLYFSGTGTDSFITAAYLRRLGVDVNAYICSRWGPKGSEAQYAPENAERAGIKKFFIDVLNPVKVKEALDKVVDIYKVPHGYPTSIGVASLWLHTPLPKERQIYGAQGADVIGFAMGDQNMAYISSFIPTFIRSRVSDRLSGDMIDNYIRISSRGLMSSADMPSTIMSIIQSIPGRIQKLSLAGMLICNTPGEGEILSAPAINSGILYSNLFYDVDVAEFLLGLGLRHRLSFKLSFKEFLDKVIIRAIAKRHHYKEVGKVRKGFIIPLEIYGVNQELKKIESPINIPTDIRSTFAAYMLYKYCESRKVEWSCND